MAEGTIGVSQPAASTTTMVVRTQVLSINSSNVHQEVLTIGDANSSLGLAAVTASAPPSTTYGIAVRIAGGPSSAADATFRVNQGVGNSSLADSWQVRTQPNSTTWASSAGFHFDSSGGLQVNAGTLTASTVVTVARMVGNSSASDYMPVRIVDSSGTGYLAPGLEYTDGSTTSTLAAPSLTYRNSSNETMRVVGIGTPFPVQIVKSYPTRTNVVSTVTSTASSAFYELISSAAGLAQCVYAYSVTSTAVSPMSVEFLSGTNSVVWALDVGSGSSGVSGANLAVTPPGAIFQTASAGNLNVRLGSTGVQVRIALAKFTE